MTMWASKILFTPCPRLLICAHPTIPRMAPMVMSRVATSCRTTTCQPNTQMLATKNRTKTGDAN